MLRLVWDDDRDIQDKTFGLPTPCSDERLARKLDDWGVMLESIADGIAFAKDGKYVEFTAWPEETVRGAGRFLRSIIPDNENLSDKVA